MRRKYLHAYRDDLENAKTTPCGSFGFRVVLWAIWTLVVVGIGYVNAHADAIAQRPLNTLGLMIYCLEGGLFGLVVMTLIEMHLEPWRFADIEG